MIAIVNKHKTSVLNISLEVCAFLSRKFYELMTAEVTKRTAENFIAAQRNYILLRVDLESGIFNEGVEQVRRHALIHIPVTGFILKACEEEPVISHGAISC